MDGTGESQVRGALGAALGDLLSKEELDKTAQGGEAAVPAVSPDLPVGGAVAQETVGPAPLVTAPPVPPESTMDVAGTPAPSPMPPVQPGPAEPTPTPREEPFASPLTSDSEVIITRDLLDEPIPGAGWRSSAPLAVEEEPELASRGVMDDQALAQESPGTLVTDRDTSLDLTQEAATPEQAGTASVLGDIVDLSIPEEQTVEPPAVETPSAGGTRPGSPVGEGLGQGVAAMETPVTAAPDVRSRVDDLKSRIEETRRRIRDELEQPFQTPGEVAAPGVVEPEMSAPVPAPAAPVTAQPPIGAAPVGEPPVVAPQVVEPQVVEPQVVEPAQAPVGSTGPAQVEQTAAPEPAPAEPAAMEATPMEVVTVDELPVESVAVEELPMEPAGGQPVSMEPPAQATPMAPLAPEAAAPAAPMAPPAESVPPAPAAPVTAEPVAAAPVVAEPPAPAPVAEPSVPAAPATETQTTAPTTAETQPGGESLETLLESTESAPEEALGLEEPVDYDSMKSRIENTRSRLKAKAFDAMMTGESALLGRDVEGGAPAQADLPGVDSDIDQTIETSLREEEE